MTWVPSKKNPHVLTKKPNYAEIVSWLAIFAAVLAGAWWSWDVSKYVMLPFAGLVPPAWAAMMVDEWGNPHRFFGDPTVYAFVFFSSIAVGWVLCGAALLCWLA